MESRNYRHRRGTARTIEKEAVALFYAKGFNGTSIRDIAAASGVGIATLFHHFPNKATILVGILHRTMDSLIEATETELAPLENPVDQLCAVVRVHVVFHCESQPESFLGNSELRVLSPEQRMVLVAKRDHHQRLFEEAIEKGAADGHFHLESAKGAARAIVSMSTAVATWYRADGPLTPQQIADMYANLALRMVGYYPTALGLE